MFSYYPKIYVEGVSKHNIILHPLFNDNKKLSSLMLTNSKSSASNYWIDNREGCNTSISYNKLCWLMKS